MRRDACASMCARRSHSKSVHGYVLGAPTRVLPAKFLRASAARPSADGLSHIRLRTRRFNYRLRIEYLFNSASSPVAAGGEAIVP